MKETTMLRYEDTAEVMDMIRAYDFEPLPGRPESWIEGIVIEKGYVDVGPGGAYTYKAYTIRVTASSWEDDERVCRVSYVPFETSMDYDGRVTVVGRMKLSA